MVQQLSLNIATNKDISPIILRDDQNNIKKQIYQKIREGNKRILGVCPCGWGKTHLAASIAEDALRKNKTVLFIAPYTCLVEQTKDKFQEFGLPVGVVAGGYKEQRDRPIQIATTQTLAKRGIDWFEPTIIFLDETHLAAWTIWVQKNFALLKDRREVLSPEDLIEEFRTLGLSEPTGWENLKTFWKQKSHFAQGNEKIAYEIIKKYKAVLNQSFVPNNKIIIGLTATPWRLSKREFMQDFFETGVYGPTPGEMVKQGLLKGGVYYGIQGADISKVRVLKGDYIREELEIVCSDSAVIRSAVRNYLKICPDRLFLNFAVTVDHAYLLKKEFSQNGVKTEVITGDTPTGERKQLFEDIKACRLQGLISVGCLGVGLDIPEISCIIFSRPTKSIALAIQQAGRGKRLYPGQTNCIYLDQANIIKGTLKGFIENITYPDLDDISLDYSERNSLKECPQCGKFLSVFDSQCACGYLFLNGTGSREENKIRPTGDLKLIIPLHQKPIFFYYQKTLREAYRRRFNPEYAKMKCKEKYKIFPPEEWARGAIFGDRPTGQNKLQYLLHLRGISQKLTRKQEELIRAGKKKKAFNYDNRWIYKQYANEFGEKVSPEIMRQYQEKARYIYI